MQLRHCANIDLNYINIGENMKMIPLNGSSAIVAAGYDAYTNQMGIQFTNNPTVYIFYNVPFQVFNEFMSSSSRGDYYHRYIEGNYKG